MEQCTVLKRGEEVVPLNIRVARPAQPTPASHLVDKYLARN